MRFGLFVTLTLVLLAAACEGPPPTRIVLVVTATSAPEQSLEPQSVNTAPSQPATSTPTNSLTTQAATPTLDVFPTAVFGQIQVAEQLFEHGRMFWIQPRKQIWVMFDNGGGTGKWQVYPDTFLDSDPANDPNIVPPEGKFQPERGFGKLWRENQSVHDGLGFGVIPEYGYVSNYEYHPGGTVTDGKYVAGPGYHILFSLYQEKFEFNEADGTWKKLQ